LTDRDRPGRQPPEDLERRFRHIVGKKLTKTKGFAQFNAPPAITWSAFMRRGATSEGKSVFLLSRNHFGF
jgi:hypothetical protein